MAYAALTPAERRHVERLTDEVRRIRQACHDVATAPSAPVLLLCVHGLAGAVLELAALHLGAEAPRAEAAEVQQHALFPAEPTPARRAV